MTFKTFILSKRPLWVDGNLRLTVDEMFALVEEWEKQQAIEYDNKIRCDVYGCNALAFGRNKYGIHFCLYHYDMAERNTQDNHLKTSG